MKWFLKLGDDFAKESGWKDFALTKFCLFAIGLAAGLALPERCRKAGYRFSALLFLATYIPLMAKVIRIALRKNREIEEP